jgi:hypothetical protein
VCSLLYWMCGIQRTGPVKLHADNERTLSQHSWMSLATNLYYLLTVVVSVIGKSKGLLAPCFCRMSMLYTFGQADYTHIRDEPDAFFTDLLLSFTPPGEVSSFWSMLSLRNIVLAKHAHASLETAGMEVCKRL